ncbi:cobalamin-dependent protein [Faecalicatena sp. AGMB00832]|uniref:Cobalamin-dependent protein n=1 Tax=Faecalicatena faecalis TaxID=2726362 RepID=A0ABS6D0N2_9FIRM|nr:MULTISPECIES: cobalamin-dependent protein [Faecalicatena]MBU3874971.1 cobalamin-dependent protein [Faecalicatena faecalis]MCI6465624.1 cobalamin-dependent protein [Faecalicatena sp.]MDY5618103.1 cobalamin-dependent protein [Lachnospiraceae bacterium]
MSLLMIEDNPKFQRLYSEVFGRQLQLDFYKDRIITAVDKENIYQGVRFCITFLYTAYVLEEPKIFEEYARWVYHLLRPLKPDKTKEQMYGMLTEHFQSIHDAMVLIMSDAECQKLDRLLTCAGRALAEEYRAEKCGIKQAHSEYKEKAEQYLAFLMKSDTKGAVSFLLECVNVGIPLSNVYVDIVAEAMRQVGELWHQHLITVDTEHYCTSVTQLAISQMYPIVFGQKERVSKKVLVACAGSELHELGARMIADLFEYRGWDSIYLGAAVPMDALLAALKEHAPYLVALSVTMPQHLIACKEMAEEIHRQYPQIKIAVGGNAFQSTNEIWKNWSVDVYTCDARALVEWAEHTL